VGKQTGFGASPGRRKSGFGTGMAAADHNDIKTSWKVHDFAGKTTKFYSGR
jgi:hypothetical protein